MINRILIRIKVVQMLYSYLLTRSDFKVVSEPASASADNKFAFAVYNDLLMMLLELTGHPTSAGARRTTLDIDRKLLKSRVGAALATDSTVRSMIGQGGAHMQVLRPVLSHLSDTVAASSVYSDYRKKRTPALSDEVAMWHTIFKTVIARDEKFLQAIRSVEGFSTVGLESGFELLYRTLDSYRDATDGYAAACNSLERSLDQAYDLYVSCFALIIELTREQQRRIEQAKTKYLATADELNPNMRFVENSFVEQLLKNEQIQDFMAKNAVNWDAEITLINSLLQAITDSALYKDYMSAVSTDYAGDCEFWRDVLRTIVFTSDDFLEALENKSVFWNDDLQIMGTFVLKTIRQAANTANAMTDEGCGVKLLGKFKDDEDARFGGELFVRTVKHREEYRRLIDRFIDNDSWDPERIAFMDIVIMLAAITELVDFPNIPLPVTMNEYVEIANDYSSPKSGQFVNGILFNVVNALRAEGKVFK